MRHNGDYYEAWRRVYDEFDAHRGGMGVKGDAVFRSLNHPNDPTVSHDFDSDVAARAFLASRELRAAMHQAGVRGEPQIWLVSPS